jgi:hypothetical protein
MLVPCYSAKNICFHPPCSIHTSHSGTNARWFVPNTVIRWDLQTPTVKEQIRGYGSQYSARQSAQTNDLLLNLMELADNRQPAK